MVLRTFLNNIGHIHVLPLLLAFISTIITKYLSNASLYYRIRVLPYSLWITILFWIWTLSTSISLFGIGTVNGISITSSIVGLIFGTFGISWLKKNRTPKVGLVIQSKTDFNQEIRKGLKEKIAPKNIPIRDLYNEKEISNSTEDYTLFESMFWDAARKNFDYIIATPHSNGIANSEKVVELTKKLAKKRRRIIFIENCPSNLAEYKGYATRIYSDSRSGANILSDYLIRKIHNYSQIVLINGPTFSPNSLERAKIIKDKLIKEGINYHILQSDNWSIESGKSLALTFLETNIEPTLFVCGNDNLALGVIKSLEINKVLKQNDSHGVVGYDGIPKALMEIWRPDSPMEATLRIPPINYGRLIGDLILSEMNNIREKPSSENCITVDQSNIITKTSFDSLLGVL